MRRATHRKPAGPMQLNLTAFIDIVFLLLIFFIVTSGFVAGEGVLPATVGSVGPPRPQVPLKIEVSSSGETGYRIELSGAPVRPASFGDLQRMLIEAQDNPKAGRRGVYATDDPLIVSPDKTVRWQHVVNAYNAAVRAGYANVSFAHARE